MPNQHTILIVDDEEMIREALRRALRREKYEIHTAKNGLEGVEKCSAVHPDVILLDIRMPVMDGMEMLRTIKPRKDGPFQVIVISGHLDPDTNEECLTLGAMDVLEKPFEPDALRTAVRECFPRP